MNVSRPGLLKALVIATLFCQFAHAPALAGETIKHATLNTFTHNSLTQTRTQDNQSEPIGFEPKTLIVKFSAGSRLASQWFEQERTQALQTLEPLLGPHDSRAFISSPVLRLYQKRYAAKFLSKVSDQAMFASPLAAIAVLTFDSERDLDYLSRKLQALPDIEYAEKMPRHQFCDGPNDPLASEQYHLDQIRAFEAWDEIGESRQVLLAIVDTGIDSDHRDLANVLYVNPGEDGQDADGNDKRNNGIDDDNNGFVDDWRGWDFGTQADGDNGTNPGNGHGTHVAGIAGAMVNNNLGVAGASPWLTLMPVKVANDDEEDFSVIRGSEGILYAAGMGAEIINCSWGSVNSSRAEAEIINATVDLGIVMVAAAGNSGQFLTFFPASYSRVLSVSSVDETRRRAAFANFHWTVDIVAPGVNITSTDRRGIFDTRDGTSMSAPMAAAAAALVKVANPNMLPEQVMEQIKATAASTDDINSGFIGRLGRGQLDMAAAVSERDAQSILVDGVAITDVNGDGIATPGEEISITIDIWNILAGAPNANIVLDQPTGSDPTLAQYDYDLGSLVRGERVSRAIELTFIVPQDTPTDYVYTIPMTFRDGDKEIGRDGVSLIINPSYRTLDANNMTITANSRGNFGYNDFPFNQLGDGLRYRDSRSLLYEGSLLIAYSPDKVSNVARSTTLQRQDVSFLITEPISLLADGPTADLEANCAFADTLAPGDAGVSVNQTLYQFDEDGHRDYTLVRYEVTNTSGADVTDMYVGLLCDWDIAAGGFSDVTAFNYDRVLYYARNARDETLPLVGMQLLSEYDVNYFALDNNSSRGINLVNGFSRDEKWFALSSGIGRDRSNVTDISAVLSAGPISVKDGETVSIAFSIFAGDNFTDLYTHADSARVRAGASGIGSASIKRLPRESHLTSVFPNPDLTGSVTIEYQLSAKQRVSISIFDIQGRKMIQVFDDEQRVGEYSIEVQTAALPVGNYVVKLQLLDSIETFALKVLR